MKPLSADTASEIEKLLIEGYRRMSAAQKLHLMQDLNRTAQILALSDIKQRYPQAAPRELQLRLASRWITHICNIGRRNWAWLNCFGEP